MYHALDELLVSGEGQEKAAGWGGGGRVDGVGMGSTIVTALLDRKRRQVPLEYKNSNMYGVYFVALSLCLGRSLSA